MTGGEAPTSVGINVVGWFSTEPGMGPVAGAYADALEAAGVPVLRHDLGTASRREHASDGSHAVTLVCMTARALAGLAFGSRRRPWPGDYVIGYWPWELAEPDPMMSVAARFVDEIWAPSAFAASAIRAAGLERVQVIAPVVEPRPAAGATVGSSQHSRRALGMPEGRVFVSVVNLSSSTNERSVLARKNPAAFIEAYLQAFTPADGAGCYLKTVGGHEAPAALAQLRELAGGRPDCTVVDRQMSATEMGAILGHAHAYVSLHRGEGFGLAVAEAMAAGVPVIATDYSGTTEFVNPQTGFPVRCRLVPVGPDRDPYAAGALWAEPDRAHAVELMHTVIDEPQAAARRARHGRRLVAARFAPAAVASQISARLAAIGA